MSATNPKRSNIGALQMAAETTFGTAGASYVYIRGTCDRSGLKTEALSQGHAKQGDYGEQIIVGPSTGELKTVHELHGWSATVPVIEPGNGVAADTWPPVAGLDHWMAGPLGSILGNVVANGYYASEAASTTSILKGADLTSFDIGQAVAWNTTSFGYQVGWATNNTVGATDEIALIQTAPATPIGGFLYGAITAFLASGPNLAKYNEGSTKSWSMRWYGAESDDLVTCLGCQPTGCKFTFAVGKVPTVEITWGVASFSEAGSGGAAAVQAWSYPVGEKFTGGWVARGTSAATSLRVSSMEIDIKLDRKPIEDPSKTNGIGGWATISRTPTIKFSVYRALATEVADFTAQTARIFTFSHGTQAGKLWAFAMPAARLVTYPGPDDDGGLVVSNCEYVANNYDSDTGSASDTTPVDTDFRIAIL